MRHGGLGIVHPTTLSSHFQQIYYNVDPQTRVTAKKDVRTLNRIRHAQHAKMVKDHLYLPSDLKYHAKLASEKGASPWLSVIPTNEHGFHLHKGEFRDAPRLRYS